MISPRWQKMIRDLWLNLPRTMLVILAIAIGIFGIGFVVDTYSILTREIDTNYEIAKPPSANLWMDTVDDNVVKIARNFPGITDAESARNPVRARIKIGSNRWIVLVLYVVDDFNGIRINKVFPESGSRIILDRQILIERSSLPIINTTTGKSITVKALGGPDQVLSVAGVAFDPGQDPAWVTNNTCGYITPGTLKYLKGTPPQKGLRIIVSEGALDRAHIRDIANRLSAVLHQKGYEVKRVEVPIPGKYLQSNKINSLLLTLVMFGFLCLLLSGFMTATLISSLLSQQIRQIGVMKALGARTRQVMLTYLGTVLCLSLAALAIGIPLGAIAGRSFAVSVLKMLNFNVTSSALPHWVYVAQIALGIIVPILATVIPVYRGSRLTVLEAIGDYGVSIKNYGSGHLDLLLERIRYMPRQLALSLRNAFRRRGRILLTLAMLAAGGASFIASLSSAASWNLTIDNVFAKINYDIDIRFGKPYPVEAIENSIRTVPGVSAVEAWGFNMSTSFPKYSDGTYGAPSIVYALKKGSTLVKPTAIEGRWLNPNDMNAIVLDTDFTDNAEEQGTPVKVGDELTYDLNGNTTRWRVIGIIDKIGSQSAAYVNYDYFSEVTDQRGKALCARVAVKDHDKTLQKTVSQALERKLADDGLSVFVIQGLSLSRQIMVNHVVLILSLLMIMSILVAAVGALGLASTMSMNVMERAREIGIMRSLGATKNVILRTVIMEGVVISTISWFLGCAVSIPLTFYIAGNTGQFIFPRIMEVVIPFWPPILWLVIVLVVAVTASFYPAWRATRLTVREVLAYE